jgi:hypothetical protein
MTVYYVEFELEIDGKGTEQNEIQVSADSLDDAREQAQEILLREHGDRAQLTGVVGRFKGKGKVLTPPHSAAPR